MFTPLVLQMISVGEETGRVDELLGEAAEFYEREVDYDLKSLTSKIEPILIMIVAAMVLVLALGIFTPMWNMMTHLGWPRLEPTSKGCAVLWQEILDLDLEVEGFKMYAEFFDGVQLSNNALASICRYRLSTGPYFEYKVYTGQVSKIIS